MYKMCIDNLPVKCIYLSAGSHIVASDADNGYHFPSESLENVMF